MCGRHRVGRARRRVRGRQHRVDVRRRADRRTGGPQRGLSGSVAQPTWTSRYTGKIRRTAFACSTLARPPANALDDAMLAALELGLDEAAVDDAVRALVIRADGAFFCWRLRSSGAACRYPGDQVAEMVVRYRDSHRKLLAFPKPTVAAVQGDAIPPVGSYGVGLRPQSRNCRRVPHRTERDGDRRRLSSGRPRDRAIAADARGNIGVAARRGALLRRGPGALRRGRSSLEWRSTGRFTSGWSGRPHCRGRCTPTPRRSCCAMPSRWIDAVTLDEELAIAALWSTPESRAACAAQRRRLA